MLTRRLALLTSVFALFGCGQSGEDPGALGHQLADAEADWDRSGVSDSDAAATSLVRMDLAAAKVRWADAGVSDYQLELSESLNYWSAGCSWLTAIVDGIPGEASISVSSSDSPSDSNTCGRGQGNTTEQLHARITQMADELDRFSDPAFGEHRLEVKFDDLGVPTSIKFDLANGNDEESSLRIRFTYQS